MEFIELNLIRKGYFRLFKLRMIFNYFANIKLNGVFFDSYQE